jgi:LPS export ABC transporter protein LptC
VGLAVLVLAAAACSRPGEPPVAQTASDSADQILYGFTHNVTVEGVWRARLTADTAYFFQETGSVSLLGVMVDFMSPQGTVQSTVTSDSGAYDSRTQDMEAYGDVVAVTPDGRRLTTSVLRFDRARQQISGPNAFRFCAPDRRLEGDGFTSDPDFRNVETVRPRRGRVGEAVGCPG